MAIGSYPNQRPTGRKGKAKIRLKPKLITPNQPPTGDKGKSSLKKDFVKVKPAIYQFDALSEIMLAGRMHGVPEVVASWGWVDVNELAEITDTTPKLLFRRYYEAEDRWTKKYHKKFCNGLYSGIIFLTCRKDRESLPQLVWSHDTSCGCYSESDSNLAYNTDEGKNIHVLDNLFKDNVYVPAGWALAVLKKQKIRKGEETRHA